MNSGGGGRERSGEGMPAPSSRGVLQTGDAASCRLGVGGHGDGPRAAWKLGGGTPVPRAHLEEWVAVAEQRG